MTAVLVAAPAASCRTYCFFPSSGQDQWQCSMYLPQRWPGWFH